MEIINIDWNLLGNISYQTQLGKSLKNTLRKFDKEELFDEINQIIESLYEREEEIILPHRIKSIHSCNLKYDKYFPSKEVEKVFNDILGIRIIIDDYDDIKKMNIPENVRMVDMRGGKANDDGYRAVHLYFQKNHFNYPIEIQVMTSRDRQFNEWLHIFLYKYVTDISVGRQLREMYESGIIMSEEDFRKEMQKLCAT